MRCSSLLTFAIFALTTACAQASDISAPSNTLTLSEDNTASLTHKFATLNKGNVFSDSYQFTTSSLGDLSGYVTSLGGGANSGLSITDFSLKTASGQIMKAKQESQGTLDLWDFTYDSLSAGTYWVIVTGRVLSNGVYNYDGGIGFNPTPAPVPEPATYALMLSGLVLLSLGSRRKSQSPIFKA